MNDIEKLEFGHNLNLSLINTRLKSLESLLNEEQQKKHIETVSKFVKSLKVSLKKDQVSHKITIEAEKIIDKNISELIENLD